ncbi:acyl-CoA reductase [Alphaproteobacteria bacterium]|nr:acyl-CoA reductase [Alphaproteobacteria bacterium]
MRLINADQLPSFRNHSKAIDFLQVGHSLVIEFLSVLSKEILSNQACREYPDVITFGYFCRKSAIKRALEDRGRILNWFGWGNAVHISPSNVPVNFAFSFVFGLLSGNANLVRLPSAHWPQVDLLVGIIEKASLKKEFSSLRDMNAFVSTERNDPNLMTIISSCDALVVWGGDDTVAMFRQLPKKPRCVEIYFPDRISSLIINSVAINELSDENLVRLANSFFNDTYLVDNNACSSPRKIIWVGNECESDKAKSKFWRAINQILTSKKYDLNVVAKIDKYLDVLTLVSHSHNSIRVIKHSEDIWVSDHNDGMAVGRLGRYQENTFSTLEEALCALNKDEQTLTYYGLNIDELRELILNLNVLVDRVVPVGMALEMGFYWDGIDVLQRLSRRINFT